MTGSRTVLALQHLAFEDAGLVETACRARGFAFDYVDVPRAGVDGIDPLGPDLLVVLGAPIGVYQTEAYPFLNAEIAFVRQRLEAGAPTLGICLGAQLMARALGGEVRPGPQPEVGYAPIAPTDAAASGVLAPLAEVNWQVLHWHGDVIAPFDHIDVLASSAPTPVQAFTAGPAMLGLQFHVEVEPADIESWLVGHARQLSTTEGVDPVSLRAQAHEIGAEVAAAGRKVIDGWLDGVL
ncbi:MAG: glutamine amidotransferase [Maricaulaceae bacterium]|jgi:GMP synthase (glutamine-hydrolysing)